MPVRVSLRLLLLSLLLLWAGCVRPPEPGPPPVAAPPPPPTPEPTPPPAPLPPTPAEPLQPVGWAEVEGWAEADPRPALEVFLQSCPTLQKRPRWQAVCAQAAGFQPADPWQARALFEELFRPLQLTNADGTAAGLVTGYYVPDLDASRAPSGRFRYPLFGVPDDLLVIDLRSLYPELGNYRLRGRLEGRRVVPYWDRREIDQGKAALDGEALFWVDDPVELFFLQVQGSGRINLDTGETVMIGYADQNGHPYRSIGKVLLERGEMTREQMSMQNIRDWARRNPDLVPGLLGENPSYVFFHELPAGTESPPGALGLPLTPEYSLAVDPRYVPLGAPVFLATTWPSRSEPLRRLMVAQDTGGAIKGPVRADFFWGIGEAAGELAGRMKQPGRMWVLLPAEEAPPAGPVQAAVGGPPAAGGTP